MENITGTPKNGIKLEWQDSQPGHQAYYIVYRFKSHDVKSLDDPSAIVAIVPREPVGMQNWVDKNASKRTVYTYVITCADRLHNESTIGNSVTIKTKGAGRRIKKR